MLHVNLLQQIKIRLYQSWGLISYAWVPPVFCVDKHTTQHTRGQKCDMHPFIHLLISMDWSL